MTQAISAMPTSPATSQDAANKKLVGEFLFTGVMTAGSFLFPIIGLGLAAAAGARKLVQDAQGCDSTTSEYITRQNRRRAMFVSGCLGAFMSVSTALLNPLPTALPERDGRARSVWKLLAMNSAVYGLPNAWQEEGNRLAEVASDK